jgi:hypothetical protein
MNVHGRLCPALTGKIGAKPRPMAVTSLRFLGRWMGLCFFAAAWSCFASSSQNPADTNPVSIAEWESSLPDAGQVVRSFRLEGIVRAVTPRQKILALQDASAAVLLELPAINPTISAGERLVVAADHCVLTRTRFGIRVQDVPVADNDGLHSEKEVVGKIFLNAGMNPIRLDWFNGPAEFGLNLDYEGPGVSRQKVPDTVLWHSPAGKTNQNHLQPGVHYEAYEGNDWTLLPDFSLLNPTVAGVATNFSADYRTRSNNCGLKFDGFIQINRSGVYTFYLNSDDGGRLYVGKSSVSCQVMALSEKPFPAPENFEPALIDRNNRHWVELEGEVTFVGERQRSLEMELLAGGNHVPVTVLDGAELFSTNLLHRWVRVEGICEFSRDAEDKRLVGVFTPGSELVKIYDAGGGQSYAAKDVLTTAAQVRRLKPAEAGRHMPVKIRGVVIYASSTAVVLEDSSGGVFISLRTGRWSRQPAVGEVWEMQGTTDPGDFSPVVVADTPTFLGYAPLPEPIQPTRDQLMNGNLDAEYGELHGVITSVTTNEITLLTPDGKVSVMGRNDRPLPQLPKMIPGGGSIVGSVVRIRGCFATQVDLPTRQVAPGKVYIYPALVEVEDAPPADPFLLPARTPADLTWFNARAIALQRTKLAGQIIYALPGEYFVQSGKTGFRVFANDSPPLKTGDLIEAVGFPKLGGASPVLQEAQIRQTGHATLPNPVQISSQELFTRGLDSTLVEVEALLISDAMIRSDEQVLELQSGPRHFVARLKADSRTLALLPAGCRLKLTGVYTSADEEQTSIGAKVAPFELLLNHPADIVVLQRPSWWTIRRAVTVAAALAGLLCVTFIWVGLLRRKVEQRTRQLKQEIEERQLVEQRHAIERERTRVAQDLHDELGSGLTEVSLLGSLANTDAVQPEARNRYLEQLTQVSRSLVTSLDEIVWAVNPHYDSVA